MSVRTVDDLLYYTGGSTSLSSECSTQASSLVFQRMGLFIFQWVKSTCVTDKMSMFKKNQNKTKPNQKKQPKKALEPILE